MGLAITILTIAIRVVLFPFFYKSAKDQALMQRIQPRIKEIQVNNKTNKEQQAKELMALYKEHKLNPFSGLLLLVIQLPVFIVLFQVFSKGLSVDLFDNHTLFGLINLGNPHIVIALIAAGLQWIQGKLTLAVAPKQETGDKGSFASSLASTGKMMVIAGPLLTLLVLARLPAALGLYWTISNLFSVIQQIHINKKIHQSPF